MPRSLNKFISQPCRLYTRAHLDTLQDGVGERVRHAHERKALLAQALGDAQRLRLVQLPRDDPHRAGRAAAHAAGPRQQQALFLRLVQDVPAPDYAVSDSQGRSGILRVGSLILCLVQNVPAADSSGFGVFVGPVEGISRDSIPGLIPLRSLYKL